MVFPVAFDIRIKSDQKFVNVYGSNDTDTETEGCFAFISSMNPSNISSLGTKGGIILLKL